MKCAVLLICACSSIATATPQSYLEVDGMLGLSEPAIGVLMGAGSGGYRFHDPWWFHGQLSAGLVADDEGSGFIGQARVGIEARPCTASGIACLVLGSDLGLEYAKYTERGEPLHYYTLTSLVAVPRVGVDVGGQQLRFRAAFELDIALFGRGQRDNDTPETFVGALIGGNVVAGAAWQW